MSNFAILVLGLGLLVRSHAAELDSLKVPSGQPGDSVLVLVIVPGHGPVPPAGWPVAYLLHGFGANPYTMLELTDLGAAADHYEIAIVCPDGRPESWYLDSPLDSTSHVETMIIERVLPQVEHRYPLRRDRYGRGILGLSMGGHGALYLALRHPGLFGVAASVSGVLDLTETTQPAALARRLGTFEEYAARWRANSVVALVDSLPGGQLALSIDCGLQDPFIAANRRVHQKLLMRQIDHVYTERPGSHDRDTFARALRQQLLFLGAWFGAGK